MMYDRSFIHQLLYVYKFSVHLVAAYCIKVVTHLDNLVSFTGAMRHFLPGVVDHLRQRNEVNLFLVVLFSSCYIISV